MTDATRVAVLIDCDNISHQWAGAILGEVARHGTLGIKRGYGDWTNDHLKNWRPELATHAIQPVQQFAYSVGKNSTDFALVIDAMDLLYGGTVDAFCLVSSDSDFTRLAMRLRESGKRVYGIGARKTPAAFQNACDQFTYVELLVGETTPVDEPETTKKAAKKVAKKAVAKAAPATKSSATKRAQLQQVSDLLLRAIEARAKEDGWASLSEVGGYVTNTNPTFDPRNYGYSKLSTLVADLPRVEMKDVPTGNGLTALHVREAPRAARKRR
ncbi:MAG TPA: NYN domain-containing protein [Nocardioides sp.]|jgi:uncharacterized protein (TIGR00288 family)|nr:NYN domain-containing protein [Nocardioides sp.]